MIRSKRIVNVVMSIVLIALVGGLLLTATGCAAKTKMAAGPAVLPDGTQMCAECTGHGMGPMVKGMATEENGVQVVNVGLKNGYYSPNEFMVKAGTPVKVVFTGKVKKCLGMPQFKSLNKKANFINTGSATIDLGTLQAGTYQFNCGMGMNGGKIVAQ